MDRSHTIAKSLIKLFTRFPRAKAGKQNNADWLAAWCGVNATPFSLGTIETLLHQLVDDVGNRC